MQVIYNAFDQSPEDQLFAAVGHAAVGVIVRVPFDEGALTGSVGPDSTFPDGDFRNSYFAGERKLQVWQRVQAICADLEVLLERLPEVALRLASAPAVTTTIPGMRSVAHVERNVEAIEAGPLDPARAAGAAPSPLGDQLLRRLSRA